MQVGNFTSKPSNTGRNWTPDGTTLYNLRAMKGAAGIADFGLDTEGGDRAKLNLLKEPMRLVFYHERRIAGGVHARRRDE